MTGATFRRDPRLAYLASNLVSYGAAAVFLPSSRSIGPVAFPHVGDRATFLESPRAVSSRGVNTSASSQSFGEQAARGGADVCPGIGLLHERNHEVTRDREAVQSSRR